ncbi:DUF2867 domain-containing protein [Luethyella okanaganae]|uniref:DUF2867 domain-containing protein n=1 Tax=Luethyella okanaganae TaxID=69372 RepID=A0ABW1VHD5_9MICO
MVSFGDAHFVKVPQSWNAREFASTALGNTPMWLLNLLKIRDRIVGKLGFATQDRPGARDFHLAVGETAGPFRFTEVSETVVRGGSQDTHIAFESSFYIATSTEGSYGVLATQARSLDRLGSLYLALIWPGHKALMGRILQHAAPKKI